MNDAETTPRRRLRLFLRDHRVLDANALVPEGQFLATYLASRNRYVNLTAISWLGTGEEVPHMALKVDKILWAASEDGELPLTNARAATSARRVEVELEGGYLLAAGLLLVERQRLTDYLQSSPSFVPLQKAELRPRNKTLGDVAVNQHAIQMVREIAEASDAAATATTAGSAETGSTDVGPGGLGADVGEPGSGPEDTDDLGPAELPYL